MNGKLAALQLYLFVISFVKKKGKTHPNPKQQLSLHIFPVQVKQVTFNRKLYTLVHWSCFFG